MIPITKSDNLPLGGSVPFSARIVEAVIEKVQQLEKHTQGINKLPEQFHLVGFFTIFSVPLVRRQPHTGTPPALNTSRNGMFHPLLISSSYHKNSSGSKTIFLL